jgi:hypothetical protein
MSAEQLPLGVVVVVIWTGKVVVVSIETVDCCLDAIVEDATALVISVVDDTEGFIVGVSALGALTQPQTRITKQIATRKRMVNNDIRG